MAIKFCRGAFATLAFDIASAVLWLWLSQYLDWYEATALAMLVLVSFISSWAPPHGQIVDYCPLPEKPDDYQLEKRRSRFYSLARRFWWVNGFCQLLTWSAFALFLVDWIFIKQPTAEQLAAAEQAGASSWLMNCVHFLGWYSVFLAFVGIYVELFEPKPMPLHPAPSLPFDDDLAIFSSAGRSKRNAPATGTVVFLLVACVYLGFLLFTWES